MSKIHEFAGVLMTFSRKNDGDVIVDETILIEVVDFNDVGEVEIAFDDRNERCYIRFSISDLVNSVARLVGIKG